jgi:hypothetical protein
MTTESTPNSAGGGPQGASSSGSTRKDRIPFSNRALYIMIGLLAVGEAIGFGVAEWKQTSNPELAKVFAAGAAALLFGALLGGIVSQLIAEIDRSRVRRAAQVDFISNILADLKGVYDRVDRGRTLILAHRSTKRYGEEMLAFIDARVKLLSVERALNFDERRQPIVHVRDEVKKMATYLRALTDEFEQHYKELSRAQSVYEAKMKRMAEGATAGKPIPLPENTPWTDLSNLPKLRDFIAPFERNGDEPKEREYISEYGRCFIRQLDYASAGLRDALVAELENRPVKLLVAK